MTDYFEEKVVNRVLSWRMKPDGVWNPYSAEVLTSKLAGITSAIKNSSVAEYVRNHSSDIKSSFEDFADLEPLLNYVEIADHEDSNPFDPKMVQEGVDKIFIETMQEYGYSNLKNGD